MKLYTLSGTNKLAQDLARGLQHGSVFALYGELGAGKTTFVKSFSKTLGIANISSPTFVLMNVYSIKNHPVLKKLCHVDAYRMQSADDLINIGFPDYMHDPETVCLIEWADKIKTLLPKKRVDIFFELVDKNKRKIQVEKTACLP